MGGHLGSKKTERMARICLSGAMIEADRGREENPLSKEIQLMPVRGGGGRTQLPPTSCCVSIAPQVEEGHISLQ